MPSAANNMPKADYDPRWFIWTIVFLVVAGISLVSYILFSDPGSTVSPAFAASNQEVHKHK